MTKNTRPSNRPMGAYDLTGALGETMDGFTEGLGDLLGSWGAMLTDWLDEKCADKEAQKAEKQKEFWAALKAWGKLETDPEKKATLTEAAKRFSEHLKAQKKEAESAAIEQAGQFGKDNTPSLYERVSVPPAAQDGRDTGPSLMRERVMQVPEYIRSNPMYESILAGQRQLVAAEIKASMYEGIANQARMEARDARNEQHEPQPPAVETLNAYEQAAEELDARTMKEGDEFEGEIVAVAEVNGKNYYVLEQDGERIAVPAGERPEHEAGDEITASRTKEGFETGESHDYGR